jgi:3-isopropylmalate dehydrogenase
MGMSKKIAILSGDGIGPEVMTQAKRVLEKISEKFGHAFTYHEALIGGAAYDKYKLHCPPETLKVAKDSDAILFGAVGGPVNSKDDKWKGCETNSILALRKAFSFNANFRPAKVYPMLSEICPLKDKITEKGVDILIVRELLGDIYFGEHTIQTISGKRHAKDVAEYSEDQIASVARIAFMAAKKRKSKVTSVDKANVLSTSKLWREVVSEVHQGFSDIFLEHMLVDNCAMQIIKNPGQFDVILTANLFGDILSDAAAVLPGSLGLTPSASLNADGFGLYEPSGGSAPDIAGLNIANPIAQILSAALMLKHSFSLSEECAAIESAVDKALAAGFRTKDIAGGDVSALSTSDFTDKVLEFITN